MTLSRRDLLKGAGMFAVGAGLGGAALSMTGIAGAAPEVTIPELPWPFKKLDPEEAAELGYAGYYKGACGYGVFEAIVGQLRKSVGFPYTVMPTSLLVMAQGGTADTASLCGALSGAANAIQLVAGGMDKKLRDASYPIVWEVFNWYEQTALPDYRPKKPKFEIVKSKSNSTLCHVSVSKWCEASNFKSFSKERSERCGWMTAAVAKYTAEVLNKYHEGSFKLVHPISAEAQDCRSCHDKGGVLENSRSMQECGGCHFTPNSKKDHPKI